MQVRSSWWGYAVGLTLFALACTDARRAPPTATVQAPAALAAPAPALPVEPATSAAAPADVNPFAGADLYVDPEFAKRVAATRAAHPGAAKLLDTVQRSPTAIWLDSIESLAGLSGTLDAVAEQAQRSGRPVLPVFVVYDLPNRDCSAKSSNGELSIEAGGEQRYRTEFIDRIAQAFAAHPAQRIAVIVEPDSLPNLVTNLGHPKCAQSQKVYASSVAYAIARLSRPNVFLYLDSAHAAWLGWDSHRARMVDVVKDVLLMAGGLDRIRGFATNVSNYTSLEGDEGQRLERSNPCPNELSYVAKLSETLEAKGLAGKGFIIDTSRNGQSGMRTRWGNWCNIAGAGLGERPRAAPGPRVDAYYWVKPPGASDGTSDPTSARFDANCASTDATPGAPEAGKWFEPYLLGLVEKANPPL